MKKLRPYGMPIEWRNAALADRLEALVQHYCTGPCGQSQTVGEIQSNTSKTLREARDELARTREERDEWKKALESIRDFEHDPDGYGSEYQQIGCHAKYMARAALAPKGATP